MTRNIYVGIFFLSENYSRGINSTIDYFNSITPENSLVFEKYIVDGTPELTSSCLNDFLTKYPSGDRATISERTTIILEISIQLQTLGLNIPCFSITASSSLIKSLPNSLTYAPFDKYAVMCNFMIYREYKMKHLKVLYEPNTLDDGYFQNYIELMQIEGRLVDIPIEVDTIVLNKNYNLHEDTSIVMLLKDYSLITSSFLSQIPKGCYISMTDINDNINDIFGDIPAFVMIPFPRYYTTTTQNVYNSLTDKNNFFYNVYGFFDILYTINFFTKNDKEFNLENYVASNAFSIIPPAFGYISLNLDIHGTDSGVYNIIFTKKSVVENGVSLFNLYNNGQMENFSQSKEIFMSTGIDPFFLSNVYICRNESIIHWKIKPSPLQQLSV